MRVGPNQAIAAGVFLLLVACTQWPRFDYVERGDTGGAPPSGNEAEPSPVSVWTDIGPRADDDDDEPTAPPVESLLVGQGSSLVGRLEGTGWTEGAVAARPECAGVPSAFPTEPTGEYRGDIDWRLVEVTTPGVLCSNWFSVEDQVRTDVMAFVLDACGLPAAAFAGKEGTVVGFAPASTQNQWGIRLDVPARYALVAAGWAPDQPGKPVPYTWEVALLPDSSSPDACEAVSR